MAEGGTAYAYCGCPEAGALGETGGQGGCWRAPWPPGEVNLEFVPLCPAPLLGHSVDVTGKDPADALLEAIPLGSGQDICRFRLVGGARGMP